MVNKYTYLEVFLDDIDKKINLNEFENLFARPHQTLKRHLAELVNEKILVMEKKNKFLYYSLNKNNSLFIDYLVITEKQKLFDFLKAPVFNRLYVSLENCFRENNILIFGSAVISKEYSDIDLLILSEELQRDKIKKTLKNFELTYSIEIHPIFSNESDLNETFLSEVIKKHIILNNHDYYVRLFYGKK